MSKGITGNSKSGWAKVIKNSAPSKPRAQARPMPTRIKENTKEAPIPQRKVTFQKTRTPKEIPPLFKNQIQSVKFFLKNPKTADFSDPGTAKTRAHLEAYSQRKQAGGAKCLLVLAPKSILQSAWGDDIEKYHYPLPYSIAWASNREEAFKQEALVYITNIDAAKWLAKQPKKFFTRFDELIIDESESIKHRTSQRSKAVEKIKRYFPYRRILSGTPNPKSVTELWNQYFFLDNGESLGDSFFRFRQQVQIPEQVGPRPEHVKWEDAEGVEEVVAGMTSHITIRHIFEECQDIPKNFSYFKKFDLSSKHMVQYNELKEQAILEIENDVVVGINAAVLTNKLLQLTSGAVYSQKGDVYLDEKRNELIIELVQERDHSLVFFMWNHQKENLSKLAKKQGIDYEIIDGTVPNRRRAEIVKAYQAGFFQTLFLHPKSAAHGLTLTRGRSTIWASPTYEPNIMRQGIGRIYRAGQDKKTENIMVCARSTLEEHVYAVMQGRQKKMSNFLEIVR